MRILTNLYNGFMSLEGTNLERRAKNSLVLRKFFKGFLMTIMGNGHAMVEDEFPIANSQN